LVYGGLDEAGQRTTEFEWMDVLARPLVEIRQTCQQMVNGWLSFGEREVN
jgi:hypothetical protein